MPKSAGTLGFLLPLAFMMIVMYLFVILPDKKRIKKYNNMIEGLRINDEVVTRGGVIGKIIKIQDDFVIIESGPDRTKLKIQKSGIAILSKGKEETDK